jgi:hypothetical protein
MLGATCRNSLEWERVGIFSRTFAGAHVGRCAVVMTLYLTLKGTERVEPHYTDPNAWMDASWANTSIQWT